MADAEHLEQIKKGVDAWNAWRRNVMLRSLDRSEYDLRPGNYATLALLHARAPMCSKLFPEEQ
jgi:hypothetical protein